MNEVKIPKRITTALVNSFAAGVVPRIGLEHVAVGRKYEVESILRELENVADGGAAFKLITGRYGSGKSFLLQMIRNYAMDRGFVVADGDLSPERRLTGAKGQGLATYRELMTNLSTRTRPDGGALESMLQKWISNLQQQVMEEQRVSADDPSIGAEVQRRIHTVTAEMEGWVHGFDFAKVLSAYWQGIRLNEDALKQSALRWLRGEYQTRTEARRELNVSVIIDDDGWYDYMKLWAEFAARIGYKGLLLFVDEGVNLYKISNSVSRQSNYEKLLTIFNDTMQGKAGHLGVFVGGTPQFVEDPRRGLYSYEALRSRLAESRFGSSGTKNFAGPVIRLEMLSHEEILLMLQKLHDIHRQHYKYDGLLEQHQLVAFMQTAVGRLGADELLTPREVVRDFVDLLNTLHFNEELTFDGLLGELAEAAASSGSSYSGAEDPRTTGMGSLNRPSAAPGARNTNAPDEVDDFLAEFDL